MQWIDTTDLKNWASRRDCQEHLPLVVRRLIRATSKNISRINAPAGDSVLYSGWDVTLETLDSTEYIPKGLSGWEIGTNKVIKKKAEDVYQKRKKDFLGLTPTETTFIFVTPRVWSAKERWCKEKKKEGFWKDVRVYGAEILEEWLEQAPAVGAWLAKHIGKYPKGATSLEDFWNEWSSISTPTLTPELVLAGRVHQIESVRKWLSSPPSSIVVQAVNSDEVLAFLAAVINTLPEDEREFYLSRSIIVNDSESFRHISTTCENGLLLIPQFEQYEKAIVASQQGHYVYIPIGRDNTVTNEKIELPRLEREEFVSALKKMGLSEEDAQRYSKDTGRSLTVLRRQLASIANQPEWAKLDSAREIIPALLAGRWTENKEYDKEIISQFAGKSYEDFVSSLSTWLHKPDSPILKIGELWRLVSPLDAFFALSPFLIDVDLGKFKEVTLKVLGSIDPTLDLEPEKRWMASAYGKESNYSGTLREGIAQTLVLFGVFGDNARISVPYTAQSWVNNIIRELLLEADWKLWHSLSDVLPLIAEASPSSFLDAVESLLSRNPSPIMGMFSETEETLTSSSAYPSLLWALEDLAWDSKLLGRVTIILGKLARLDPGGRLANRPNNSLRTIFLLWLPHTYATLEQRLEALDTLIERESEVGWELLVSLMPRWHDICAPTHKTRWRQFSENPDNKVTITEHLQSISAITDRLIALVGTDGNKWADFIEHFPNFPPVERAKVVDKLSQYVDEIEAKRFEVWNKLRKILSHHRSFPDAKWALPEQELNKIETIYLRLEPQDIIKRYSWLFDEHWPDLPEGKEKGDYKKRERLIAQRRMEAIETIKNKYGLDGLIKLASQTENPWIVGITTAEHGLTVREEQSLFPLLNSDDEKKVSFVQSYILQRIIKERNDKINSLVETACSERWQPNKIINLFLAFPQNWVVWDLLASFGKEIEEEYWRKLPVRLFDLPTEDKIYALTKVSNVKRYFTALDIAALFAKEIPAKLIAELLQKAATGKSIDDIRVVTAYDIEELFKVLDESNEIGEQEIAKLEWLYLPILASVGSGRPSQMLHQELSGNPDFFSEVIRYVYKPKNEDKEEEEELPQELKEQRAHLAWKLLHTWKTVPGSDSSGQIDYETLKSWVVKARELCQNIDRKEVGDIHIGQVLAHAKSKHEGMWPPEAVCKLIEEIQSDKLDNGFSTEIYNKRRTVAKSPFEEGQQERALAEQFRQYAGRISTRYPRTAAILEKIAEGYENEAKREDKEAEKRDLEY